MVLYAQNINKNVQHELTSVPRRVRLKVASHIWESPPWQLAFTRPQLAEWQDTWEPLTHLKRGLLRPEQREMSTADWFCTVKPIIVGLRRTNIHSAFSLRAHVETNIMKGGIRCSLLL